MIWPWRAFSSAEKASTVPTGRDQIAVTFMGEGRDNVCLSLAIGAAKVVATFLVQGIQPTSWWEKDRAVKATRIAIELWLVLLGGLVGVVLLFLKGAHGREML